MHLFPTSILLGLAGFDILGAIIIITALSMNSSKKNIYVFSTISLLTTIIVGLLASQVLGTSIEYITKIFHYIPDTIYAIIWIIIGITLLYWFIKRVFKNNKYQDKTEKKESFFVKFIKKGMFLVAILFTLLWSVPDPSFWGVIAIAVQNNNIIMQILAYIIWMVVSQLPMYILTIAIIFNKHEKVIKWSNERFKNNKKIEKIKKILQILVSIIILITSIYFISDSVYYFVKGTWLF